MLQALNSLPDLKANVSRTPAPITASVFGEWCLRNEANLMYLIAWMTALLIMTAVAWWWDPLLARLQINGYFLSCGERPERSGEADRLKPGETLVWEKADRCC